MGGGLLYGRKYCIYIRGITFIRHTQSQNIRKPINLQVFDSKKKIKGTTQDSQNQLWSPMPAGGEP